MIFSNLSQFRQAVYNRLGNGRDAIFDLMDAVLTTVCISSFVHLSQSPLFRRQWPSVYEALEDSRPQSQEIVEQLASQVPSSQMCVFAVDHTDYPRPEAKTLKDRMMVHQAEVITSKAPITIGYDYSTISWIPPGGGSWALPLLHERISSFETPTSQAIAQVKTVIPLLDTKQVLVLFDAEYGNAKLVEGLVDSPVSLLARLRPNRCVYGEPLPYSGKGRPRKHGHKFKLKDSSTWPPVDERQQWITDEGETVEACCWHGYHFRQSADCSMSIIRIEVLSTGNSRRRPSKALWLMWRGPVMPTLPELRCFYHQRFQIDHWNRFMKQRLHWTIPKLGTPEQLQAWSDLMPLMSWQLWLARDAVNDNPLPWQKPQSELTPGRVAQGFAAILAAIGSPACNPKPRGKSPGWPSGKPRQPRTRYPMVKKHASRKKKQV